MRTFTNLTQRPRNGTLGMWCCAGCAHSRHRIELREPTALERQLLGQLARAELVNDSGLIRELLTEIQSAAETRDRTQATVAGSPR